MDLTNEWLIIAGLMSSIYVILLMRWLSAWNQMDETEITDDAQEKISIIIAARNEAENIEQCLFSLVKLNYPQSHFEVIVMNDHSEDDTEKVVRKFISNHQLKNFKLITPDTNEFCKGKKGALSCGIQQSNYHLIITTDADCEVPPNWLKYLSNEFKNESCNLVAMPVSMIASNFFHQIQWCEMISLQVIGAAQIELQKPILCNGANLAFRKKIFFEVGGYEEQYSIASGDDTVLMKKVNQKFSNSIRFLKNNQATVITKPESTLKDYFSQRKRWAGKISVQMKGITFLFGLFFWCYHLMLLTSFIAMFFNHQMMEAFLVLFSGKFLSEIFLLKPASDFFQRKIVWLWLPIMQMIYSAFQVVIGVLSLSKTIEWKGRRVH